MPIRSLQYRTPLIAALALALPFYACSSSSNDDTGAADTGPVDQGPKADTGTMNRPDTGTGLPDTGTVTPDGGNPTDSGPPDSGALARSLILLHTNDEHSHEIGFGPEIDDYPTPAPPGRGIQGGIKRRAKKIQDLVAAASLPPLQSPVALVSAGDLMIGTVYHLGDALAGLDYNLATLLSYDVITLGNHEFEFGPNTLAHAISKGGLDLIMGTTKQLGIPIVSSNIRFSITSTAGDIALENFYTNTLQTNTLPMGKSIARLFVKNFGTGQSQVKVGFLGLMGIDAALVAPFKSPVKFSLSQSTTPCTSDAQCGGTLCLPTATAGTSTTGYCATTNDESDVSNVTQLVKDAAAAVAELRANHVDLVVALCHVGVNDREVAAIQMMGGTLPAQPVSEEILLALGVDQALAQAHIPGIDVIIGGHSHSVITTPLSIPNQNSGIKTTIVQAGSYGRYVGKLRLTQNGATAPWVVDTTYSGLEKIDDTVSTDGLGVVTDMGITAVLNQLIDGVEQTPYATAGNGIIEPGEECDGQVLPNMGNCVGTVPGATGGTVTCDANRQLVTTGCMLPTDTCGNGTVEGPEQCDGAALNNQSCAMLGYLGGTLSCNSNCTFNVDACMPFFPSLSEIVLNFANPGNLITHFGRNRGDLLYYHVGTTTFDVTQAVNHESNLMNLVTDAERWGVNKFDPASIADPVRVTVNANGQLRDPIQKGQTGALSVEDLFRVLPLGSSPASGTPLYPMTQFYVFPAELKAALELGVGAGSYSDAFWLGVSGAHVEYDLSKPPFSRTATAGRITKIVLTSSTAPVGADGPLEATPLFDASLGAGAFPNPLRPIHVGTGLYITLFAEALGICPRYGAANMYKQFEVCASCTQQSDCTAPRTVCATSVGRCVGGTPAAFLSIAGAPVASPANAMAGYYQELKEFFAFLGYIRNQPQGALPAAYNMPVPRRMCCVGSMCSADRMCPQ